MTLSDLLSILPNNNPKATQFQEVVNRYPIIGELDAWDFLRSALKQIECPACEGYSASWNPCRYCAGTGKVDAHLLHHPMNIYNIAKEMRGKE